MTLEELRIFVGRGPAAPLRLWRCGIELADMGRLFLAEARAVHAAVVFSLLVPGGINLIFIHALPIA